MKLQQVSKTLILSNSPKKVTQQQQSLVGGFSPTPFEKYDLVKMETFPFFSG